MLGLAPARQDAAVAAPDVYGAPLTGAVLASLGMLAFGMLALMPTTFGETSLLRTMIALSLAAGGAFGVLIGYVSVSTRIEVGRDGLVIAAPGWRCEVVQISVARGRSVGGRTRLAALNPVFILTAWPDGLEGAR